MRAASVTIRWARPEEAGVVWRLVAAGMREEGLVPEPEAWLRTWRAASRRGAGFRFLVAAAGRRIVGCMSVHRLFSTYRGRPVVGVEDVYVVPSERDQGVGSAMLLHVERWALRRGAARMELHVRRGNRARRLYRRHGFEPVAYDWMQRPLLAAALGRKGPRPRAGRDSNPRSPA